MTGRKIMRYLVLAIVASLLLPTTAHATFAGTNGKIAFSRNGDIFLVDPDGTDRVRLTDGRAGDYWPVFSPDGQQVAFLRSTARGQDVFVAVVDGTSIRRVTRDLRGYADPPVWSPDGQWLAFDTWVDTERGMGGAVYVVRSDGSSLTRLTGYWPRSLHPAWSPDSTRLVFARHGIVVIDRDGANRRRLTTAETTEESPAWSPNGDRIIFGRSIPGPPHKGDLGVAIISIAPDGTDGRQLTDGIGFDFNPQWSPNGSRIAFLDFDPNAGTDLWVMNADGSDQRGLTVGRIAGQNFAWSPDGSAIAFDEWNDVRVVELVTGEIRNATTSPKTMELLGDWQTLPN